MHKPVLAKEVLDHLLTPRSRIVFDATVGTGGHSEAIAAHPRYQGNLICSDRDRNALEIAESRLARYRDRITFVHLRFSGIGNFLSQSNLGPVSGFLFDLGLCTLHLESKERGFSFQLDGPLDMRMDRTQPKTALEVINHYPAARLADIFRRFGQEKLAGVIARAIVRTREKAVIRTTFELRRTVEPVLDPRHRIKSLARVFQAIRIEVNDELSELKSGLEQAISHLVPGGRLAVISYHSLEHRLIREKLRRESRGCVCPPELPVCTCGVQARLRLVAPKPILPSAAEILENPQSRSAKLWVAERLATSRNRISGEKRVDA
jgi:16S rRNA (cytosine1402-N4)-methyltransferase